MESTNFSSLARPLDIKNKTNLYILILTLFTIVAGTFIKMPEGIAILNSFLWSLSAGFMVFISWAISRELDPDYPIAAFISVGIVGLAIIFIQELYPDFLLLLFLLLVFRLINRTVGPPAKWIDSILIAGVGIWLSFELSYIISFVLAIAFWLDSSLPDPLRRQKLFAGLSLATGILSFWLAPSNPINGFYIEEYLIYEVVIILLFIPVILLTRSVRSDKDLEPTPLHLLRVRAVQIFALVVFLVLVIWEGYSILLMIMPLAASFVGISLYRLFHFATKGRT
ncbi:MAG: hypothetical protein ACNS62_02275 [Candidatus Cyclobacteriaceae bacterium M3_2C_046]